jgi:hypothetical protein
LPVGLIGPPLPPPTKIDFLSAVAMYLVLTTIRPILKL